MTEEIKFESSEGLHPREELLAMAKRYLENADVKDRDSWQRAQELAVSFYDRFWEG
jgi:hypothetical protein